MRPYRLALAAATALTTLTAPTAQAAALAPNIVQIRPITNHIGAATAAPLTTAQCEQQFQIACYGPQQLEQAYDLPAVYAHGNAGQGHTIAIVDSFGSPTVEHDLK